MTTFTLKLKPIARKDQAIVPLEVGTPAEIAMSSKDTGFICDLQVSAADPVGDTTKYMFTLVLVAPGAAAGTTALNKSWVLSPQAQPYTVRHIISSLPIAGTYTATATVALATTNPSTGPANSTMSAPAKVVPTPAPAAAAPATDASATGTASTDGTLTPAEQALEAIASTAAAAVAEIHH